MGRLDDAGSDPNWPLSTLFSLFLFIAQSRSEVRAAEGHLNSITLIFYTWSIIHPAAPASNPQANQCLQTSHAPDHPWFAPFASFLKHTQLETLTIMTHSICLLMNYAWPTCCIAPSSKKSTTQQNCVALHLLECVHNVRLGMLRHLPGRPSLTGVPSNTQHNHSEA